MAKKEYKLDPQTLTFEVIRAPFQLRTYRVLRRLLVWFIAASVFNFVFSYFFYTPKMYFIERENREMLMKYEILQSRIDDAAAQLNEIKHRDQAVYRPLFGQDTLYIEGIYTPYPNEKYARLYRDRIYSPLMLHAWQSLDQLGRSIYLESVSMDNLQSLSFDKERMAVSIPAIWPIDRDRWNGAIAVTRFWATYARITASISQHPEAQRCMQPQTEKSSKASGAGAMASRSL